MIRLPLFFYRCVMCFFMEQFSVHVLTFPATQFNIASAPLSSAESKMLESLTTGRNLFLITPSNTSGAIQPSRFQSIFIFFKTFGTVNLLLYEIHAEFSRWDTCESSLLSVAATQLIIRHKLHASFRSLLEDAHHSHEKCFKGFFKYFCVLL